MTTTAETAKAIRTALKANYPAVTFKVTSHQFAGGDDVNVSWTDGPTEEAINRLLAEYVGGYFDPMIDLYTYNKLNPNKPTVKYLMTNRHFSPAAYATHRAEVCAKYGINTNINDDNENMPDDMWKATGHAYLGQLVTHELHQMDLTPLDETTRSIEESTAQDEDATTREISERDFALVCMMADIDRTQE